MKAYGVASHRHTPEIEAAVLCGRLFGCAELYPHLVPMNRGILVTAYASLKVKKPDGVLDCRILQFRAAYDKYYQDDLCACCRRVCPETKWVRAAILWM
ncbi:MAG: hypothetical protein ACLURV_04890 [Gallintestinimicrobium sp.]